MNINWFAFYFYNFWITILTIKNFSFANKASQKKKINIWLKNWKKEVVVFNKTKLFILKTLFLNKNIKNNLNVKKVSNFLNFLKKYIAINMQNTVLSKTPLLENIKNLGYLQASFTYNYYYSVRRFEFFFKVYNKNIFDILLTASANSLFKQNNLIDLTAFDKPGFLNRFTVVYIILSLTYNIRINFLTKINEISSINSVTKIFFNAYWSEREVWDLFGIKFYSHPDMRRILTDYNFKGHPLRKDYPLTGFIDVFYDDKEKRVVYVPVELTQEFRIFEFKNPWK